MFVFFDEKTKNNELTSEISVQDSIPMKLEINENSNKTLKNWIDFYKSLDSTFSIDGFSLEESNTLTFIEGHVLGNYDKDFDTIYSNFIVFSPDKKKYIDFDSYQWTIDEKNEVQFTVDQEINLIDIENKTIQRIAFFGSSRWVENTFWENDSIVYLLENSDENLVRISKIDIISKEISTYKYQYKLNSKSEYSEIRIKSKL